MSHAAASPNPDTTHPDLRFVARVAPRHLVTPTTLPYLRALTKAMAWHRPRGVEVVAVTTDVGVRLQRPKVRAIPGAALLWLHGGGYVMGTAAQDDRLCRRYASALGATVAAVDYRLAPEHPYPTPLEDCYRALTWLARQPTVDPRRIVVGGASGGGGLAAAVALLARDRGEIALAAQLLAYPMLDDRTSKIPRTDNPGYRMWNHASNAYAWSRYLGGADPEIAVPARAHDVSGLPPAWLGVGTLDLFHDEDVAYAARLTAAGVPCHLEVVPGAFHTFDLLRPKAPVSQRFFDSQCAVLRDALTLR
jgi:acetyl esterase/lipase